MNRGKDKKTRSEKVSIRQNSSLLQVLALEFDPALTVVEGAEERSAKLMDPG